MLIESRLSSLLKVKGFKNFTEYINFLEKSTGNIQLIELVDKISTNHTYFFRESKHFDFLNKKILPKLAEKILKSQNPEIRIWSAGCSSGEEPYTIAMILQEYMENNKANFKVKILATDISISVLREAHEGIYPEDRIINLPKYLKTKYLNQLKDDKFQVKEILKKWFTLKN